MTFLLLAIGEGAADITTTTPWLNVYCAIAFWVVSVVAVLSGLIYAKDGWHIIKTKAPVKLTEAIKYCGSTLVYTQAAKYTAYAYNVAKRLKILNSFKQLRSAF